MKINYEIATPNTIKDMQKTYTEEPKEEPKLKHNVHSIKWNARTYKIGRQN